MRLLVECEILRLIPPTGCVLSRCNETPNPNYCKAAVVVGRLVVATALL